MVRGTEKLLTIQPYFIVAEKKAKEAISLFNRCQFEAALIVLSRVEEKIRLPRILERVEPLKNAAMAYSLWDRFDHKAAFEEVKKLKMPNFDRNKAFLGKLLNAGEREPYLIADLINNAIRRGDIEQKYDDAVARFYRVTELIAQYRLKKYGVEGTGDVHPDKIPKNLTGEIVPDEDGRIRISMHKAYQLLAACGDEIGKRYESDKVIQNELSKRNTSILAHGLSPMTKDDYEVLKEKVIYYAKETVPSLNNLLGESRLMIWMG